MDLPPRTRPRYDFRAVYHEHFDSVWIALARLGVRQADLEDAAQDVFVVAYRRQSAFDGSCGVRTWLFGISRRIASNYRRRDSRHRRRVDAWARVRPQWDDARDMLRSTDGKRLLQRFLASLDDGKRSVFVLCELEQHTSHEVAQALGLNRNTVAARLRAARQAFDRYARRTRQQSERPPPQAAARVLGLVMARVEVGSPAAAAMATLSATGWVKATVTSVAIAVAGLGAVRLLVEPWRSTAPPPTLTRAHGAATAMGPSLPPDGPIPEDEHEPPPAATTVSTSDATLAAAPTLGAPPHAAAAAASDNDQLARQNQQLHATRAALEHHDAQRALTLIADYERAFPAGFYGPEMALARVEALCMQGSVAQARGEARLLRRRFPRSTVIAVSAPDCPRS